MDSEKAGGRARNNHATTTNAPNGMQSSPFNSKWVESLQEYLLVRRPSIDESRSSETDTRRWREERGERMRGYVSVSAKLIRVGQYDRGPGYLAERDATRRFTGAVSM